MRLSIDHRTRYRFTEPQARLVQLLRMTPQNTHDQTVVDWHIAVDCDARMTQHRDGFGNVTAMLYCEGPLESIEITVTGEVVTSHSNGVLHGAFEPLPPRLFLRPTPATQADAALVAFAREAAAGEQRITALHRLNAAVRDRFTLRLGRPEPGLGAAEAFAHETATARDLAHILIAGAHVLGIPARYVTGYCDLQDHQRPTPHGWMEAWLDDFGWIGFDPTIGLSPEEHHVRVAVALDAAGASPVAGSRLGEGDEEMDVAVRVSAEE